MQKLKVFVHQNVSDFEDEVNGYLSDHPDEKIINIFATECALGETSWSTVYLLLETSQEGAS